MILRIKIVILTLVFLTQACNKKNCPPCFSYAQPLRFSFLDSNNINLLNPSLDEKLEVNSIHTSGNTIVHFELKSTIGGVETGFWFIESIDDICIDEECELYVSYTNSSSIDTLNVLYEEFREVDEDGCVCTSYPLKYFKYNGTEITEFNNEPNNTGAAIIRK